MSSSWGVSWGSSWAGSFGQIESVGDILKPMFPILQSILMPITVDILEDYNG